MSKSPPRYHGTHTFQWRPENAEKADRRTKNLTVYRDLERRKQEQHNQNWFKVNGRLPPLTPAQVKAGARRVA